MQRARIVTPETDENVWPPPPQRSDRDRNWLAYPKRAFHLLRLRPLGVGFIALLTFCLAASDWSRHRLLNDYWYYHPVFASGAIALYFAALAAVVVRTWNADLDLERYRRVRNIGYKTLIQSMNEWRDMLVMAVNGQFPVDPPPRSGAQARREITWALHRGGFAITDLARGVDRDRLDSLLQCEQWATAAYRLIYNLKLDAREALAHWSALVLSSPAISRDIAPVGVLIDALEDLQRPLQPVHRPRGAVDDEQRRAAVVQLWTELLFSAVVIEEFLVARFREVGTWRSAARVYVPSPRQEWLSRHKAGDPAVLKVAGQALDVARAAVRDQYPQSFDTINMEKRGGEPGQQPLTSPDNDSA